MKVRGALLGLALLSSCSGNGERATPSSTVLAGGPLQDELDDAGLYRVRGEADERCRVSFGDWLRNVTDKPIIVTSAQFESTEHVTVLGIMKLPERSRVWVTRLASRLVNSSPAGHRFKSWPEQPSNLVSWLRWSSGYVSKPSEGPSVTSPSSTRSMVADTGQ